MELGFHVHMRHFPEKIISYLQVLECEYSPHLVQTAQNYVNHNPHTDILMRFSLRTLHLHLPHCWMLESPLPNYPHWFLLFRATEDKIQEIFFKILQLYTWK
jgi:hypothetical protein